MSGSGQIYQDCHFFLLGWILISSDSEVSGVIPDLLANVTEIGIWSDTSIQWICNLTGTLFKSYKLSYLKNKFPGLYC